MSLFSEVQDKIIALGPSAVGRVLVTETSLWEVRGICHIFLASHETHDCLICRRYMKHWHGDEPKFASQVKLLVAQSKFSVSWECNLCDAFLKEAKAVLWQKEALSFGAGLFCKPIPNIPEPSFNELSQEVDDRFEIDIKEDKS